MTPLSASLLHIPTTSLQPPISYIPTTLLQPPLSYYPFATTTSGWSQPAQCITRQSLVNVTVASPVEEFWTRFLMRLTFFYGEGETPRWHLAICFLLSWTVVSLIILKGKGLCVCVDVCVCMWVCVCVGVCVCGCVCSDKLLAT